MRPGFTVVEVEGHRVGDGASIDVTDLDIVSI
jgi:hypothetical protein